MPRKPRMYVAGMPCHVIQRGNDRQACFFRTDDYLQYLHFLELASSRYRVAIHAYVLMTNHVHLLMTPSDKTGISLVIQSIGRRYVQYVNFHRQRSGTLWEGRHKASLVDAESYLLACYRYIELNPVRAGIVRRPSEYCWSSYARNALGAKDSLITDHPLYSGLGENDKTRRKNYRKFFQSTTATNELCDIRLAAHRSTPLGRESFKRRVAKLQGIEYRPAAPRGRPKRSKDQSA